MVIGWSLSIICHRVSFLRFQDIGRRFLMVTISERMIGMGSRILSMLWETIYINMVIIGTLMIAFRMELMIGIVEDTFL